MARILVIDDELDMLILIKNILQKENYIVEICQHPLALDENKLSKYDLILLDIMMPDIDGMSFCKKNPK